MFKRYAPISKSAIENQIRTILKVEDCGFWSFKRVVCFIFGGQGSGTRGRENQLLITITTRYDLHFVTSITFYINLDVMNINIS